MLLLLLCAVAVVDDATAVAAADILVGAVVATDVVLFVGSYFTRLSVFMRRRVPSPFRNRRLRRSPSPF